MSNDIGVGPRSKKEKVTRQYFGPGDGPSEPDHVPGHPGQSGQMRTIDVDHEPGTVETGRSNPSVAVAVPDKTAGCGNDIPIDIQCGN